MNGFLMALFPILFITARSEVVPQVAADDLETAAMSLPNNTTPPQTKVNGGHMSLAYCKLPRPLGRCMGTLCNQRCYF